ncbi:MAG TPA: hypothetical protein VGF21_11430 [Thermoleophilaceae bacterium]
MRTPLRRLAPAVLLVIASIAAAGCGGGGNDKDAQALLDKAFKQPIDSADLNLDAEVQVKGSPALSRPVRIEASGPFKNNKGKLPSTNLELKVGGGAQTIQTGFLSTGDRAFIKFQDVYYEQPASKVAQANRTIAGNGNKKGNSLKALGLDPRRWLKDAHDEGSANVAGADTTHVSGKLDVSKVVKDFNSFVKRSGGAIGGTTGQVPKPLSQKELDKISGVVKDPTFDVYVAKKDDTVRRISGHLELDVPKNDRKSIGGIEGGSLSFTIELSKVNGNQQIVAPAKARPLSELTRSLGTTALGGSGGSSGSTTTPAPSSSGPGSSAYKRYAQCLDKADPQDTDALQRCAELLQ